MLVLLRELLRQEQLRSASGLGHSLAAGLDRIEAAARNRRLPLALGVLAWRSVLLELPADVGAELSNALMRDSWQVDVLQLLPRVREAASKVAA